MDRRELTLTERSAVPMDGALLGYGAMVPFPLCLAAAALRPDLAPLAARAAVLWGAAILLFLSGVRRGLSFRTEGGPRAGQIAMMAWLFGLGLALPLLPVVWGLAGLAAGFASLLVLDPLAARTGAVPLYFARLRPVQMAIPVGSALLLYLV